MGWDGCDSKISRQEKHINTFRKSRQRPALYRMWPAPPHIACPRAITRQKRIKQRFIHVLTNSRLIHRAALAFKFHQVSFPLLPWIWLQTHLFDLLKSFLLLRTSPFFLSPFPSFSVRHKKVSHSDGAVGSVRWFRGKGSWQTGSFLTARADIISRVLDWIPKKKTIASSCPLHYYYSSHCLQKGLKHVIVKRRGFECYLQSSPCLSLFIWFP